MVADEQPYCYDTFQTLSTFVDIQMGTRMFHHVHSSDSWTLGESIESRADVCVL